MEKRMWHKNEGESFEGYIDDKVAELQDLIDTRQLEIDTVQKMINLLIAFDHRAIQFYYDEIHPCLKIYIKDKEISITFKKIKVKSKYGNWTYIPDDTRIYKFNDKSIDTDDFDEMTIDSSDELIALLNSIN